MSSNNQQLEKGHEFWKTQPVPQDHARNNEYTPIETKTVDEVRKEPYELASVLEWWVPDIMNDTDLDIIHGLLAGNYVEDTNSTFRFNYTKEFLRWALCPPGYKPEWHVCVRKKSDKSPVSFISGIPYKTRVGPNEIMMCEINFLCVCKSLRGKKMAPKLIQEITRRVNVCDIWQAVYTAGTEIPTPIASPQYYHRNLNPTKLVDIGFSSSDKYKKFSDPQDAMQRALKLPDRTQLRMRPMTKEDLPIIIELLQKQLQKFKLTPVWTIEEAEHFLMPREGILYSFVKEDKQTKIPTDFVSFYAVPSTILGHAKYAELKAAYGYYYGAFTVTPTQLFSDALIHAAQLGFDVFNVVTIMENAQFLQELKFAMGDGKLHYYLYNYKMPTTTKAGDIGLVML